MSEKERDSISVLLSLYTVYGEEFCSETKLTFLTSFKSVLNSKSLFAVAVSYYIISVQRSKNYIFIRITIIRNTGHLQVSQIGP